jgi:rRNA maturation endonuclease Nob1
VQTAKVLDTAALMSWPLVQLHGGVAVEGQIEEVRRLSEARLVEIDAANLKWMEPSEISIEKATSLAISSGDLAGLSEVDLRLLALTLEKNARLHTDDYRLQNICQMAGLSWSSVEQSGISQVWSWEIRCEGCGEVHKHLQGTIPASKEIGRCNNCGSRLSMKRKR